MIVSSIWKQFILYYEEIINFLILVKNDKMEEIVAGG